MLACVLGACGTDSLPLSPRSGTRLAVRAYTFEDGTVLVDRTALHDLARGEDCTPQRWSDGGRYCTPDAADVVYVDPQCLTRAARVSSAAEVSYGVERSFDGLIAHLFVLGSPYGGGTGLTYRLDHGHCEGPFGDDGNGILVQLTDEVPRDDLVAVNERIGDGARLQRIEVTSEDGLALVIGFHDRQLVLDCAPDPRADAAATECAPIDALTAAGFTDASCEYPVARAEVEGAAIASGPAGMRRYFAAGEPFVADAVWRGTPDACTHTGAPVGNYVAAGPALATATLDRVVAPGGRMRLIDDDGVSDAFVHDTSLDADCAPGLLGGELRCLPVSAVATIASRYTDAACTMRVDVAYVTGAGRFAVDTDAESVGCSRPTPGCSTSAATRPARPPPPSATRSRSDCRFPRPHSRA